jgi:intracellular sulfur oxidation DsrE/DsrF family protein
MGNPFLVIAVPYDGIAQDADGKDREAFENLVQTLLAYEKIPATLCFYTAGVRWVTHESPFVEELKEIRARGADIVACRASMKEAGLLDELAVGRLDTADRIDDMLIGAQHAMVV